MALEAGLLALLQQWYRTLPRRYEWDGVWDTRHLMRWYFMQILGLVEYGAAMSGMWCGTQGHQVRWHIKNTLLVCADGIAMGGLA
eukprot:scaffold50350_cov19-Tisochrysis_lutea.AAC.1